MGRWEEEKGKSPEARNKLDWHTQQKINNKEIVTQKKKVLGEEPYQGVLWQPQMYISKHSHLYSARTYGQIDMATKLYW